MKKFLVYTCSTLDNYGNGGYIMGHKYTQKYFSCVVHAVDEFCREKNLKIDAISNCAFPSYCIQVKK